MAPSKRNTTGRDDTPRAEAASTMRERQQAAAAHARNSKKTGGAGPGNTSSNPGTAHGACLAHAAGDDPMAREGPGMSWETASRGLLHAYRGAHQLETPAAFTSARARALLTRGIGRRSPTMAQARERRRVSREQLALAVRKHFNGQGVGEGEVIGEFVYRVKQGDRVFRMRSAPQVVGKKTTTTAAAAAAAAATTTTTTQ